MAPRANEESRCDDCSSSGARAAATSGSCGALRHPDRPAWLVPAAVLLAFFALEPANLALPVLGAVDDFLILPLALRALLRALPPHLRNLAR